MQVPGTCSAIASVSHGREPSRYLRSGQSCWRLPCSLFLILSFDIVEKFVKLRRHFDHSLCMFHTGLWVHRHKRRFALIFFLRACSAEGFRVGNCAQGDHIVAEVRQLNADAFDSFARPGSDGAVPGGNDGVDLGPADVCPAEKCAQGCRGVARNDGYGKSISELFLSV